MANNTMNFGVDLLPTTTNTFSLGSSEKKWIINGESNPKLTDTTYTAGTGIGISGTTINNTGVTSIKGNSESNYRTGQVILTAANIGAVATTGGTMSGNLNFKDASSADSPDIVWMYGDTNKEQARIWMGSGGTTKWAPSYRCCNPDGTILYSGKLVLEDGTGATGNWGINITGTASTADAFSANKEIKLTGDVTGSASSTGGWSIATTIGANKVTNAMLAGSIANEKLVNSSLTVGNKTISLGTTGTVHDILYNSTNIGATTSWDIIEPGVYVVASNSKFTGNNAPETDNGGLEPYRYGQLIVSRANTGGVAEFYISHRDSTYNQYGIKYRTGWNSAYTISGEPTTWATILDSGNYIQYTVTKDGSGASGTWNISISGTAKYADMLTGFTGRGSNITWGNQTGTAITVMNDSTGGSVGFRRDNPTSGQMSMVIDGTIYIKEGAVNIGDAVKSFSVSGTTVTYTTLWGNTGTFTTQDTDTKVTQNNTTTTDWKKIVLGYGTYSNSNDGVVSVTNTTSIAKDISAQPSTGTIRANIYRVQNNVELQWNSTDESLDFVFI